MNIQRATIGMRVAFLPGQANGNIDDPSVERGAVSSVNARFIFVKFDDDLATNPHAGAKACFPWSLVSIQPSTPPAKP